MTDPVVPPRPAPPLPTDPSWTQGYAAAQPAAAPIVDAAPAAASRGYSLPTDPAHGAQAWPAAYGAPTAGAYGAPPAAAYAAPTAGAYGSPASVAPTATTPYGGGAAYPGGYAAAQPAGAQQMQTWQGAPAFAAPYTAPQTAGWQPPASAPTRILGVIALVVALVAAVGAPIVGGIVAYVVGQSVGHQVGSGAGSFDTSVFRDLSILTPVRGVVLIGEIAFWAGTVLGIWALAQGIFAIVKNRGRGFAIAAVILAVVGVIAFVVVVYFTLIVGFATGAAAGISS